MSNKSFKSKSTDQINQINQITWKDSTAWDVWLPLPLQNTSLSVIKTVGYVIEETKNKVVIAHSFSSCNHVCGTIAIPKGCIIERKILSNIGEKK